MMKRIILYLALLSLCSSISSADFTYVISDTYEYGVTLEYNETLGIHESLLVTGGGQTR